MWMVLAAGHVDFSHVCMEEKLTIGVVALGSVMGKIGINSGHLITKIAEKYSHILIISTLNMSVYCEIA